jgi:hypothetical protein
VDAVNDCCQESISPTQYTFPHIRRHYKGANPQCLMTFTIRTRKPDRPERYVVARRKSGGESGKGRVMRPRLSTVQEGDESQQDHTDSAAEGN